MRRCGLLSASVVLLACALLVSCAKNGYPPADVSEPFVTWDGESTIPFIYSVDNTFFLGVWDVEHGKVSFDESPPFSLDGQSSQLSWDGGDRFAFAGTEVTKVLDMSSRGRDEVLIIYEMVGGPSEGTGQIRIHLVRRDGKWKVEMIGMDI